MNVYQQARGTLIYFKKTWNRKSRVRLPLKYHEIYFVKKSMTYIFYFVVEWIFLKEIYHEVDIRVCHKHSFKLKWDKIVIFRETKVKTSTSAIFCGSVLLISFHVMDQEKVMKTKLFHPPSANTGIMASCRSVVSRSLSFLCVTGIETLPTTETKWDLLWLLWLLFF